MDKIVSKTRSWFLTINEGAESFGTCLQSLASYDKCEYSAILHDKDDEEQKHYHICILFENGRTFEQVQKKFKGAHIEMMESKYMSFRYLLHLDNPEKFQYDIKDVIQRGNNVEYYSTHDEYIKLDTESVLENIQNGSIKNILDAVKIFGIKQSNMYRNILKELLEFTELRENVVTIEDYRLLEMRFHDVDNLNDDLTNIVADLRTENNELTMINNKLLSQVREYEKILKERGLL
jgi:hypothetical protein